jgi:hypothetical protein
MFTVLKIIGVLAIIVVLVLGIGAFWFIRLVRKAIKEEMENTHPPCRVNPVPEPNPQWRNAAQIERYAGELAAVGFERMDAYSIPELGGLQILSFMHPRESLYGVIYDHAKIAPTFEIGCDFEDDTGVSGTNTDMGKSLDKRPGYTILWLGNVSAAEVLNAVRAHPATAAPKPVSRDGFIAQFKKEYVRSVNWRMKKGGSSREEIKRQAQADGLELTEEQLEESYQRLRADYLRQLRDGCMSQFLDEQGLSAEEWERIRGEAFAIPETMGVKEISEIIQDVVSLDEEQRHQLSKVEQSFGESAVEVIRRILCENIGALGLETVGEVQEPVHAIILKAKAA